MSLLSAAIGALRPAGNPTLSLVFNLPAGTTGVAYSGYVHATNANGATGAISYSVDTLPAGLSLDPSTGAVTGTPTTAQSLACTFTITNGTQTSRPIRTLSIAAASGSDTVTLMGTLNGSPINVTASRGQRVPLTGSPTGGSLMYFADGLCACIENMYAGLTGDISGTFTLSAGDTVLWDGPLTIYAATRTRPFWLKAPTIHPHPDLSLFPKYGGGFGTATMYSSYTAADNSPMGRGVANSAMGSEGEQPPLGQLPRWDAAYLTNPTDQNYLVARGMADSACVWGFHFLDFATNKMLSVVDYPTATKLNVYYGVNGNPITAYTSSNPNKVDSSASHAPVYCALMCALSNTDFDREELALWANYCGALWQSPSYRLPSGMAACNHGQTRGKGRGLIVVLYASAFSDSQDYFKAWVNSVPPDMNATWLTKPGIQMDQGGIIYASPPYAHDGFAPWQNHILHYALGLGLQFGYTEFQSIFDAFSIPIMDSLLAAQHEFATIYSLSARDASGNILPTWLACLQETAQAPEDYHHMAEAIVCASGTQELQNALSPPSGSVGNQPGDFVGGYSSIQYASMMRPAIAMIASYATDQTRAQAAWNMLTTWDRADYSINNKYSIIPPV